MSSDLPSFFPSARIPCDSYSNKGLCDKVSYCSWVGNGNTGVCAGDNGPQECLDPNVSCTKQSNCCFGACIINKGNTGVCPENLPVEDCALSGSSCSSSSECCSGKCNGNLRNGSATCK